MLVSALACASRDGPAAQPLARPVPPPEGTPARPAPSASPTALLASAEVRAETPAAPESSLGVRDSGIFSDLDARVRLSLPRGLDPAQITAVVDRARAQLVLYLGSRPIKVYPLAGSARLDAGGIALALRPGDRAELAPLLTPARMHVFEQRVEMPPGDLDDDGIPDPLDVLIGAHKTALNADRYDGRYEPIAYPNGDVPREIGVCTDVVIRALRNAGFDLQRAVHEDIRARPRSYPMVQRANPSIDHRRVKSLLPYFARHFARRSARVDDPADPLQPGDVVFMDTFPNRPGTEHVGIVADYEDASGRRLVINNWTDGTVTKPMELLSWVPVTDRFRLPERLPDTGPLPALKTQLLAVRSGAWSSFKAELQRYERRPGARWTKLGGAIPVVLGRAGYGYGDGLHGRGAPPGRSGPDKREGDGRSPAGLFELGTAYGYAPPDPAIRINYQTATDAHRCVDDPISRHYNRIVSTVEVAADFRSAERMRRDDDAYALAIEVLHNRPAMASHGSCIFLHVWTDADTPVTGCTAMAASEMQTLARWLLPNAAVLVALPDDEYRALQREWGLP